MSIWKRMVVLVLMDRNKSSTMKEKIFDIIAAARTGDKTVNEATNEVLLLFNVIKSVCEHDWQKLHDENQVEYESCKKCWKVKEQTVL